MRNQEQVRQCLLARSVLTEAGCREWQGGIDSNGYGRFFMDGKPIRAHRATYLLAIGPLTREQHILHRCDNRKCINPVHLSVGSNLDNIADKTRKGRAGKKLTLADACQVRDMLADRIPQKHIAEHFGVNQSCISTIANGKAWARAIAEIR